MTWQHWALFILLAIRVVFSSTVMLLEQAGRNVSVRWTAAGVSIASLVMLLLLVAGQR